MSKTVKGCLLAGLTGILWALSSPISKYLGRRGTDILNVTLIRVVLTSVLLAAWFLLKRRELFRIDPKLFAVLFLFGPFLGVGLYYGFGMSAVYLPVATALVIHYTFPMMVTVTAALLLKERPTRSDVHSALLIIVGVVLCAFTPQWTIDTTVSLPGVLWGFAAVVGMVGQTLFSRLVVRQGKISSLTQLFYVHISAVFWLAVYRLFVDCAPLSKLTAVDLSCTLVQAVCSSLIAYAAYGFAMIFIPASTASMMASGEIVGAVAIAAVALGEWPTVPHLLGCAAVMTAICVSAAGQRKRERFSVTPSDVA